MNNVIARTKDVGATYEPLTAESVVASGTLFAPPTNDSDVYVLGDDGGDFPLSPGQWEHVVGVDLSCIRVKGSSGDALRFFGGTW